MASSFLVSLVMTFSVSLFLCNAEEIGKKSKSSLVEGILKKVFNITLTSFANTPYEEREKMMIKIEEKLNKSAQFLGRKSGKYVSLIMGGVRSLASKNEQLNNDGSKTESDSEDEYDYIDNVQKPKGSSKAGITKKYKYIKIQKPANKIGSVDKLLKHAFKKRGNIVSQQNVINLAINKEDVRLLNKDLVAKKMKNNANIDDSKKDDARRMEFEFIDSINVNKDLNAENLVQYPAGSNKIEYALTNIVEPHLTLKNVTLKQPCQDKNSVICLKIKLLRTIKCSGKDLSVERLCDGIDDCFDFSDEQDCAIQGAGKVRSASQIMSDIEHLLSNKCYTAKLNDSLIAKQNEILRNVLQSQLKFIQKYAVLTPSRRYNSRKFYTEPDSVRKSVNEVAVIISTLSFALERAICSSEVVKESRKFNDLDDKVQTDEPKNLEILKTTIWSPNSCSCIEDECVGKCSENCEAICLQRYQIGRLQCKAISNQKTIPMDLICDGKLDCYDEADENGCSIVSDFTKFEAGNLYSSILDMIATKTKSANFDTIRNKLINLQRLIENLQKVATKRKPDVPEVKTFRDQCFSEMMAIYDQSRYYAVSMTPVNEIYLFLMSMSEKLVNAMKRSHIGNDRIIAPDGCFCRDNKCALLKCSETCVRACPAEPKLTRYFCGGSVALNQSIPIEAICNGKDDCADKDDEEDCSDDICRRHHLVVLRRNLQEAIERKKDTAIFEALKSWTTKVSATLKVLESNERPTPMVFRDIVNDMLHDLVMTYASLGTYRRRNSDDVIDQFYKTALIVMSSLKSCAK